MQIGFNYFILHDLSGAAIVNRVGVFIDLKNTQSSRKMGPAHHESCI